MFTQNEALKLAMAGDTLATMAIIANQSQGKWMRLYPGGRKGPLDEGYSVFLYGSTLDRIFITTGKMTNTLTLTKEQAAMVIRKSYDMLADIEESCCGDDDLFISRREELLRGRTPRLSISCIPQNDQVVVKLTPRSRIWSLSYRDTQQFACKVLDAVDALGWSLDELGVADIAEQLRDL
jgi:hypothetical protein